VYLNDRIRLESFVVEYILEGETRQKEGREGGRAGWEGVMGREKHASECALHALLWSVL